MSVEPYLSLDRKLKSHNLGELDEELLALNVQEEMKQERESQFPHDLVHALSLTSFLKPVSTVIRINGTLSNIPVPSDEE